MHKSCVWCQQPNQNFWCIALCIRSPDTHLGGKSSEPINWIPLQVPFIKTQLILLALTSVKRAIDLCSFKSRAQPAALKLHLAAEDFIFDTQKRGIFQNGSHWVHAIACYAQWTGAPHCTPQRSVSAAVRRACKLAGKWIVTSLCGGDWSWNPTASGFC